MYLNMYKLSWHRGKNTGLQMNHSAEFCFYSHGKLEYTVGFTNNAVDAKPLYNNTIRTADELLYWALHQ